MLRESVSDIKIVLLVLLICTIPVCVFADEDQYKFYWMEVGLQGGAAYYAGELAEHVFVSTRETYGAQARVKITPRWAVQLKGQYQRVSNTVQFDELDEFKHIEDLKGLRGNYSLPVWHFDVVGEYNFFELGLDEYNIHMRSITPYMFVGVGASLLCRESKNDFAVYLPLGVGVKWKFAERWQLQLTWQHNVYMYNGDGFEGDLYRVWNEEGACVWDRKVEQNDIYKKSIGAYPKGIEIREKSPVTNLNEIQDYPKMLDNSYKMNGSNIMNNDVTSTLTIGVVFEFTPQKKLCVLCED